MALDLGMLLQMRQHYDKWDSFLVNHAPKVLNGRFERSLRSNEELVIPSDGRVDEVRINVGIVDVFIPLDEANASMFNY